MLAMQLNLRLDDGAVTSAAISDCVRHISPRRDLVHASCLVEQDERCCAPLYIWRSSKALSNFLFGGSFAGVVNAHGRPRVRTWNVLEFDLADSTLSPSYAVREVDTVDADTRLCDIARRESERHREILASPGLVAHTTAVNPDRWEIVRFSLWRDADCAVEPSADCVQAYTVA